MPLLVERTRDGLQGREERCERVGTSRGSVVCAEFFIEHIFSVFLEDVKCLAKNEQYLWMQ